MELADLSYDPRDPLVAVPGIDGVQVGVVVFTTDNRYGLPAGSLVLDTRGDALTVTADTLAWAAQQQRDARGRARATVRVEGDGAVTIDVTAHHEEPVKAVTVVLRGLPAAARATGWWHPATLRGTESSPSPFRPLRWCYPFPDWVTPFAACGGEGATDTAVVVSVDDDVVRPKRLFVSSPPWAGGDDVVEVVLEERADRWSGRFDAPTLRLAVTAGSEVGALVTAHLDRVEEAHGLVPWDERADVPSWFRDVELVVNLHGRHWTGYVFNTYEQMGEALRFVRAHRPDGGVLAYLPGWEGRYYHDYPWYRPDPALGGAEGFTALVAEAHDLGVAVMPMFGVHGVNAARFPDWEEVAVRTRHGRAPWFLNLPDWDGDRSGEDDQVFCNPAHPAFGRHLDIQIGAVVDDFGVDGVFLDTTGCWTNDPRHDLLAGYRRLAASLRADRPDLLVAGEGWWDALLGVFPVNQSWFGLDPDHRAPEALTRWGRCVGHLSLGAPGRGSSGVHEAGFLLPPTRRTTAGHLPTVAVVDDTLAEHAEELAAAVRDAGERTV